MNKENFIMKTESKFPRSYSNYRFLDKNYEIDLDTKKMILNFDSNPNLPCNTDNEIVTTFRMKRINLQRASSRL